MVEYWFNKERSLNNTTLVFKLMLVDRSSRGVQAGTQAREASAKRARPRLAAATQTAD